MCMISSLEPPRMDNGANPGGAALEPIPHTGTHGHDHLSAIVYHSSVSLAPGASSRPLPLVQYLLHLRQRPLNLGQPEGHLHGVIHLHGFRPYFGDMTLWNILASCAVRLYTSPYSYVTNVRLWAHGRSVASQPASMEGGTHF